jgi:hypothetical protein
MLTRLYPSASAADLAASLSDFPSGWTRRGRHDAADRGQLEVTNRTDRDIRIVQARLRDHAAEQTVFTVGSRRGRQFRHYL